MILFHVLAFFLHFLAVHIDYYFLTYDVAAGLSAHLRQAGV